MGDGARSIDGGLPPVEPTEVETPNGMKIPQQEVKPASRLALATELRRIARGGDQSPGREGETLDGYLTPEEVATLHEAAKALDDDVEVARKLDMVASGISGFVRAGAALGRDHSSLNDEIMLLTRLGTVLRDGRDE